MKSAKPLPTDLIAGYHGWRDTTFDENKGHYAKLADEGQFPHSMVISCCDSRVHITSVFGVDTGEFFTHRNIANLVPPYAPDGENHATSAALEYAVGALGVSNIIVMGHSQCGGVKGCHDMCSGNAPQLSDGTSAVGKWIEILRPAYERVKQRGGDAKTQVAALEREGVLNSLENLMTFPFIKSKVDADELSLHGLWFDIRDGHVEMYDADSNEFKNI